MSMKIIAALPHKCTDRESSRYALANVQCLPHPKGDGVYLASTDGRCLAISVAQGEGIPAEGCMVPGELLAKVSKPVTLTPSNGPEWQARNGAKITIGTVNEGRFPRVEECLPDISAKEREEDPGVFDERYEFVSFDPELLLKVAETIKARNDHKRIPIVLAVPYEHERPIVVLGDRGYGVVMPVVIGSSSHQGEKEHQKEVARMRERYEEFRASYTEAAEIAKHMEKSRIEAEIEAKEKTQEPAAA